MTNITWVDELPPSKRTGYKAIVDQLADNAGQWAIINRNVHKGALAYVKKRFPDCEWAIRKDKQPSGVVHNVLYGRYVGE